MITFCCPQHLLETSSPEEKGYPTIIEPVTYFVGCQFPKIVGYSSFSDMGDFYFVGNTYVFSPHRGEGLYSKILTMRNEYLNDKPKITLVNPIENTNIEILNEQVAKQGGVKVEAYSDVSDIMSKDVFRELTKLPMFIYR